MLSLVMAGVGGVARGAEGRSPVTREFLLIGLGGGSEINERLLSATSSPSWLSFHLSSFKKATNLSSSAVGVLLPFAIVVFAKLGAGSDFKERCDKDRSPSKASAPLWCHLAPSSSRKSRKDAPSAFSQDSPVWDDDGGGNEMSSSLRLPTTWSLPASELSSPAFNASFEAACEFFLVWATSFVTTGMDSEAVFGG